jgi:hypothetical protein
MMGLQMESAGNKNTFDGEYRLTNGISDKVMSAEAKVDALEPGNGNTPLDYLKQRFPKLVGKNIKSHIESDGRRYWSFDRVAASTIAAWCSNLAGQATMDELMGTAAMPNNIPARTD